MKTIEARLQNAREIIAYTHYYSEKNCNMKIALQNKYLYAFILLIYFLCTDSKQINIMSTMENDVLFIKIFKHLVATFRTNVSLLRISQYIYIYILTPDCLSNSQTKPSAIYHDPYRLALLLHLHVSPAFW